MNDFEREYYESDSFWKDGMLQDEANKQRIQITADLIPGDVNSLVDIGCGNGVFLKYLQKHKPQINICGVDRSETALKFVTVNKVSGEINALPFPDNSFDCVSCLEVIEHLPVPIYYKSLSELARVAKDYLIISVPYNEILEEAFNQCPSCKSIFNLELHLRNFDDDKMEHLMDEFGFKCVSKQKLNRSTKPKGHHYFRKLFYSQQFLQWHSPICPICGFSSKPTPQKEKEQQEVPRVRRSLMSYFTALPKMLWPKEERFYWILVLYKRNQSGSPHSNVELG